MPCVPSLLSQRLRPHAGHRDVICRIGCAETWGSELVLLLVAQHRQFSKRLTMPVWPNLDHSQGATRQPLQMEGAALHRLSPDNGPQHYEVHRAGMQDLRRPPGGKPQACA